MEGGRGSRSYHLKIGLTLNLTAATTDGEGTSVQQAAVGLRKQGSGIIVKLGNEGTFSVITRYKV